MGKYEADRRGSSREQAEVDKAYHKMTDSATRKQPTAQQIASRRKALKNQNITIIACCSILAVLLIALICGLILSSCQPGDDGKILPHVYAAGIDLGGMTRNEAVNALHLVTDKTFSQKDMVVTLPDGQLTLSPAQTQARLDVEAVADAAYNYGRSGSAQDLETARKNAASTSHTIALLPYLTLDLDYIQSSIQTFCDTFGSQLSQPTAQLEGHRPAYDPEHPDLSVEHQTLVIVMGTPDYAISASRVYDQVLDAYSLNQFTVSYDAPTLTEPTVPSAQELFQKFCVSPEDATMDSVTFEVTPEVYGYGFDVERLQQRLDAAEYGETIQVQLGFLMPDITAKDLTSTLFKDTLAIHTLANPSGNSTERDVNLDLSAMAINGIVIKAGEEFSFNNAMGRPTAQKGYLHVTEMRDGKLTDVLGGGISQTASALYYCALLADLDILERHSNEYAVEYTRLGLDAFVDWGIQDLRLRNNTGTPIRIIASANGSEVTVKLLGENDKDYTVQINAEVVSETAPETIFQVVSKDNIYDYTDGQILQVGVTGYEVQTSIDKIEEHSGRLISSTLVDTSTYKKQDQIIVQIEGNEPPTAPTEESAPNDPTEPTEESQTDPTETTGFFDIFFP